MFDVLLDRTYRRLFAAQFLALIGTGLATVALGLLAFELAGGSAGLVLGTVFALKMVTYVAIAPIAGALAERLPRRAMLVSLDVVRCAAALCLPFVEALWQVYLLILLIQAASAAFTPTFQAAIPDVLPEEDRYTRALSLSRLAYDLENLASPILAAALLAVLPFGWLFCGTAAGFAASGLLVLSVLLPRTAAPPRRGFVGRATRGLRIYLATPRLRGLLGLSFASAAAGALVIVGTVVLVRLRLDGDEQAVAQAFAAFGAGSMLAALALPRLLNRLGDRPVMLAGGALMAAAPAGLAAGGGFGWIGLLLAWFLLGVGNSAVLTPAGRLLRRSAHPVDRPALFAAQFALSHLCWLVTYPLAGLLLTVAGPLATLWVHAALAALGTGLAVRLWPAGAPREIAHSHDDLPRDHPHLRGAGAHKHRIIIDDFHPRWPRP